MSLKNCQFQWLKWKTSSIPWPGEYVDDSKNILQVLGIEKDKDDDEDVEYQT